MPSPLHKKIGTASYGNSTTSTETKLVGFADENVTLELAQIGSGTSAEKG